MPVDTENYHILTVAGYSSASFDEATSNAISSGWHNHHDEFERFVSYEVVKLSGEIEMVNDAPVTHYRATVAISAVHGHHDH